jgi:hypothetical protein
VSEAPLIKPQLVQDGTGTGLHSRRSQAEAVDVRYLFHWLGRKDGGRAWVVAVAPRRSVMGKGSRWCDSQMALIRKGNGFRTKS